MPSFSEQLSNLASYFVPGGSREEPASRTTSSNADSVPTSTPPETELALDGTSERIADEPNTRSRPTESKATIARKRVDDRSAHWRALSARTIQLDSDIRPHPRNVDTEEELREFLMARHQSHKFSNTLGQPIAGKRVFREFTDQAKSGPTRTAKPFDSTQRQTNRSLHNRLGGDGFEGYDHNSKRRKLDVKHSGTGIASDPVDLSASQDDTMISATVLKPGLANSPPARSTFVNKPHVARSFDHKELNSVDAHTRVEHNKRRRKSKDHSASSQQSPRETPIGSQYSEPARKVQRIARVEIPPEERETLISTRKPDLWSEPSVGERPPPINLKSGPEFESPRELNSDEDIQESGKVLYRSSRHQQPIQQSQAQLNTQQERSRKRRIAQPEDSYLEYSRRSDPPVEESSKSLRKTFVRDGAEIEARPRQRASQSMKAHSSADRPEDVPMRDSLGSMDELAGETNVVSPSRQTSPMKKKGTDHQTFDESSKQAQSRSRSPPEPKPTQLKKVKAKQTTRAADLRSNANDLNDPSNPNVVRVKEFYSVARVVKLGEGEIRLRYEDGHIELLVDGAYQRHPAGGRIICITTAEVQKVHHSPSYAGLWLYGSTGAVSNGHICIIFFDTKSVNDFFSMLGAMSEAIHYETVAGDKLMRTIKKKSSEILETNESRKYETVPLDNPRLIETSNRKRGLMKPLASTSDEDEHIKYDSPEPHRKSTRSSMKSISELKSQRSSIQESKLEASEISKYFETPGVRRSSRQSKPVKTLSPTPPPLVRWTRQNKPDPWPHSVVYPPEGARRATVDFQDLERLDEGEFLNDNVISFALRRIEENMAPEHKENVHFFNSFFYSTLTSKTGRNRINYDAVNRWTKNKDLFSLPYIVVPINIDLHWFVAIICNLPRLSRTAEGDEDDVQAADSDFDKQQQLDFEEDKSNIVGNIGSDDAPQMETRDEQHPTVDLDKLSISDDGKQTTIVLDSQGNEIAESSPIPKKTTNRQSSLGGGRRKRAPPSLKKYSPDEPAIITLDSFGSAHSVETRNLKEYLNAEAVAKRSMTVQTTDLQGLTAKGIPEQTNFCDCGVYLVGYIEEFAKDPRKFVTKVLTRQLESQSDFASFDPSAKRAELRNELLQLQKEQENERKAKKSAKKPAPKAPTEKSAAKHEDRPGHTKSAGTGLDGSNSPFDGSAETGKSPSKLPAETDLERTENNSEEGRDLELSVPQPLHLQSVPDHTTEEATQPSTTVKQDNAIAYDSGEPEEMLDDVNVENPPSAQARDAQATVNPTDALAAIYEDGPLQSRGDSIIPMFRNLNDRSRHNRSPEALRGASSSLDTPGLDGTGERGLEVQDSQEEQTHRPQSASNDRKISSTS